MMYLTAVQWDIMRMRATGHSLQQIAQAMRRTTATVAAHLDSIQRKLDREEAERRR